MFSPIPTYANWIDDHGNVFVHGSVGLDMPLPRNREDRLLRRVFFFNARVLGENDRGKRPPDFDSKYHKTYILNDTEAQIARHRVQGFARVRVKRMGVSFHIANDSGIPLRHRTGHDGEFSEMISLPRYHVVPSQGSSSVSNVEGENRNVITGGFRMSEAGHQCNESTPSTPVYYVSPRGLTVVSNIDDVLRVAEIWNYKQGILNVFARPFRPWRNMPDIYSS